MENETKNLYICCNAEKFCRLFDCAEQQTNCAKNKRKYCKTIKIDGQKHKNRVNMSRKSVKTVAKSPKPQNEGFDVSVQEMEKKRL